MTSRSFNYSLRQMSLWQLNEEAALLGSKTSSELSFRTTVWKAK